MQEFSKEPMVSVGIVSAGEITFALNGDFSNNGSTVSGRQKVYLHEGRILWDGKEYTDLLFCPMHTNCTFTLQDVVIGVNFHWERHEAQTFEGTLRIIVADGKLCAINQIALEKYLKSVISSEMSSTSSIELLKAHAVISRSWLLAQIRNRQQKQQQTKTAASFVQTEDRFIRWFDRDDHTLFDVCADDHCQRYQGISRMQNEYALAAIEATRGQVLMNGEELCDARFSKCCGGVSEEFQYCWDNIRYPYLAAVADVKPENEHSFPDLTEESAAEQWILNNEPAFCNTQDKKILRQVLNDYDQETADFYRWEVTYMQQELANLITEKTGISFGEIIDLIPLKRGRSARIYELKIVGTNRTLVLGKELEIRRALSPSHLYSSAFVVFKEKVRNNIPGLFVLKGAGWGHGVGLCQIGAAVMGAKGYDYLAILKHYYQGAEIKSLY